MITAQPPSPVPQPGQASAPRFHWEDFQAGARFDFGGLTLTREAIIAFAREFDPQPFHLDEDAARESLFGGLCASGWHTCALTMRMMCDAYLNQSASLGSPGIDQLRWLKPVFPGDTLRVHMRVLEARPMASRPGVGLVLQHWTVHNQHGEPVMTMQGWGMLRQRDRCPPAPDGKR
jgi:acyl dehydratase